MRYSGIKVIKEALTGHKGWKPAWREPDPKPHYDIVIIGGGGHGLATAHYLAKVYKQKKISFAIILVTDAELQKKIPAVKQGSGYILHSDHSISSRVEFDTYAYFVKRGLELGAS